MIIIGIIGIIGLQGIPQAFAEESGITYDVFDNPPKFFGDNLIIASPGKSIDGVLNAGGISVIDVNTNSLLYTINNPDPTETVTFGQPTTSEMMFGFITYADAEPGFRPAPGGGFFGGGGRRNVDPEQMKKMIKERFGLDWDAKLLTPAARSPLNTGTAL